MYKCIRRRNNKTENCREFNILDQTSLLSAEQITGLVLHFHLSRYQISDTLWGKKKKIMQSSAFYHRRGGFYLIYFYFTI